MTTAAVSEMLKEVGVPTAYYQFDEGTALEPPFLCFFYPSNDGFSADNQIYVDIRSLQIELYTDEKDFALEKALDGVLASHGISYSKRETYISSERLFEVIYTADIIITED